MGSILATGTKRRAPPAWCKAGQWGLIPPLIAGKPIKLTVYARWRQKVYGVDVDLIESFQLSYDVTTKDWSGASSNEDTNLCVSICSLDEKDHYDVEIVLRSGTTIVDSHDWHDVTVPDKRPFDTGLLEHVLHADDWYYQVHAKG